MNDQVGTPRQLVRSTGESGTLATRKAWGQLSSSGPGDHTPLRHPGQHADIETGLFYNRWRHYDPDSARFSSPDPLGATFSPNLYEYAPNPFLWIDPSGLITEPNKGTCPQHGGKAHDAYIKKVAKKMVDQYYGDVRVNQQQVDAKGNVVGRNRPDVQGTHPVTGERIIVEVDTTRRGCEKHQKEIPANDPAAKVVFVMIDAKGSPIAVTHPKTGARVSPVKIQ